MSVAVESGSGSSTVMLNHFRFMLTLIAVGDVARNQAGNCSRATSERIVTPESN
jgi:hypothetical protein